MEGRGGVRGGDPAGDRLVLSDSSEGVKKYSFREAFTRVCFSVGLHVILCVCIIAEVSSQIQVST